MISAQYSFEKVDDDNFEFYENGIFLLQFSYESFRQLFEELAIREGKSSHWIGAMLRLFLKKFPPPYPKYKENFIDKIFRLYEEKIIIDYLRERGFHVTRKINIADKELIEALESKGYLIEGLINDCYYNSEIKVTYEKHEI